MKDSASALGQTKKVLKRVDESLASVQDDLGALQSSQMYQKLTSLEGIDADSIAGFMSSPVECSVERQCMLWKIMDPV